MKNPVIILHGALGSGPQLKPLEDLLSPHFNVHTISLSGHGGQPFMHSFSIENFTRELSAYMSANDIAKADIFGYSMGGYVALNLARKEPHRVGKIFTLGTKLHWTPEIAEKEVKMLNADKIAEKVPAFATALAQRHEPNDWKEVLSRTASLMIGLGQGHGLTDQDYSNIAHEVIIGIGLEDNMVTLEESRHVADLLPNGALKEFDGFKHPVEQIDTRVLAQEITAFFQA